MKTSGDPLLTDLELAGLLSARLAHSLSNHLSIIAGNLCAAGMARGVSEQSEALQAAITATNQAGSLLTRFVQFRRSLESEDTFVPLNKAFGLIREWVDGRPGWTFESDGTFNANESFVLPLRPEWLKFLLNVVGDQSRARSGKVRLGKANGTIGRMKIAVPAAGFMRIDIQRGEGSEILDWARAEEMDTSPILAAAAEILRNVGSIIEAPANDHGNPSTTFTLAILPIQRAA